MPKLERASQYLREKVGQGGEVTADPAYDGAAALHRKTMADVETLGAGLCEHLVTGFRYFDNTVKLLDAVAARSGGEVGTAAKGLRDRAAYVHATVRRSAGKVLVDAALDPLRHLATSKTCGDAMAFRDRRRLELDRAARKAKEGKGERALAASRREVFDADDAAAKRELALHEAARDALLERVASTLAAAQAELFGSASSYAGEAAAAFPGDRVAHFRRKMRALVEAGGPPVVEAADGAAAKVFAVVTGKKTVQELADDRRRVAAAKRQRAEAQAAAYESGDVDRGSEFGGAPPPLA